MIKLVGLVDAMVLNWKGSWTCNFSQLIIQWVFFVIINSISTVTVLLGFIVSFVAPKLKCIYFCLCLAPGLYRPIWSFFVVHVQKATSTERDGAGTATSDHAGIKLSCCQGHMEQGVWSVPERQRWQQNYPILWRCCRVQCQHGLQSISARPWETSRLALIAIYYM